MIRNSAESLNSGKLEFEFPYVSFQTSSHLCMLAFIKELIFFLLDPELGKENYIFVACNRDLETV